MSAEILPSDAFEAAQKLLRGGCDDHSSLLNIFVDVYASMRDGAGCAGHSRQ